MSQEKSPVQWQVRKPSRKWSVWNWHANPSKHSDLSTEIKIFLQELFVGKISLSLCVPVFEIMKQNVSVFCYGTEIWRVIIVDITISAALAHDVLKWNKKIVFTMPTTKTPYRCCSKWFYFSGWERSISNGNSFWFLFCLFSFIKSEELTLLLANVFLITVIAMNFFQGTWNWCFQNKGNSDW